MGLVLALSAEAADAVGRLAGGARTEAASDGAGLDGVGLDGSGPAGARRDGAAPDGAKPRAVGLAGADGSASRGAGPDGVRPGVDVEGFDVAGFDFTVPDELSAHEPAEAHGVRRDQVRMLVGRRSGLRLSHHVAADLPQVLRAGDLLVVNNSGTLPAALDGRLPDGTLVALHVSSAEPGAAGEYLVELRKPWRGTTKPFEEGTSPAHTGLIVALPGGAAAQLTAEFTRRLWYADFRFPSRGGELEAQGLAAVGDGASVRDPATDQGIVTDRDVAARDAAARDAASAQGLMIRYLARHGKPIRYSYVDRDWSLSAYQTAFAVEPGSSEMPSAARPFTPELVAALVSRGILIAPVTLHTGVASPEAHEAPYAERYRVPETTARLVNHVHAAGGRVIAVGTTAVRALESAVDVDVDVDVDGHGDRDADVDGRIDGDSHGDGGGRVDERGRRHGVVHAADGWTDLVITPARGVRVVDGLLTGWHEPRASHLLMLEAVAGRPLLDLCYAEAIRERYLWHEFGDINLLLRDK